MLIDGRIFIPDFELEWQFVQSPGPGGQNVNKVATSARLTFRLADSVSLPPEIKARLLERLGSRLNATGELVVVCHESRSQSQNRREAGRKLAELISGALVVRRKRRPTRPTAGSVRRRLAEKSRRSELKRARSAPPSADE